MVGSTRDHDGTPVRLAPYGGEAASLLAAAGAALEPGLRTAIDDFYREIANEPGRTEVLQRLDPEELNRLKDRQVEHLRALLDPATDRERLVARGREIGRVHSMVALETDWYAGALAGYAARVLGVASAWGTPELRLQLHQVFAERMVHDLSGVLAGYRELEQDQLDALRDIARVVGRADTLADFERDVLGRLAQLEGLVAGSFGRPDHEERFQFEVVLGAGAEEFMHRHAGAPSITTLASQPTGQGPGGRAWRSGEIDGSPTYLTDPSTAAWHDIGARHGWRSSAAVPLDGPDGERRALLSLYAAWPGYFSHSSRRAFLLQLRQLLEPGLARLEARARVGTTVISYSDRMAHLTSLTAGGVVMVYQPVVELATGALMKLEALARLDAGTSLLSPAEFLPAFGDAELLQLFEIGLDQSLSALRSWELEGVTTGVSVNLPANCGVERRYVSIVEDALERTGVAPGRLTLELLESGAVEGESGRRFRALDGLRKLGVHLAEDDLGAGYSSLLRLRNIAFDEVKIDQQLLRDAELDPRAALYFIQPLASLARSLGLTTTVEGLETKGLIEAAVFLGADAGQGYAIARPMRASLVAGWARTFRLDIDHSHPRTALGGLAAHLAWENRFALALPGSRPADGAAPERCPLHAYICSLEDDGRLGEAHARLHDLTVASPRSAAYTRAWERLERLLVGVAEA